MAQKKKLPVTDEPAKTVEDGLVNLVSGLGTKKARDPSSVLGGAPLLDRIELEDIYRHYWISKAVDIKPWDMTREWRTFKCNEMSPKLLKQIELEERRTDSRNDVRMALIWASLFGGAGLIMHVDGHGDMSEPLDYTKIKKGQLNRLTPADRWELIPQVPIEYNPLDQNFGTAPFYRVATDINNVAIDRSRIIFFRGREMPIRIKRQLLGWGESDIQRWYKAVISSETLSAAILEGVHQSNIDVVAVKGLAQLLATNGGEKKAMDRFLTMDMAKSMLNMSVIDAEDSFTRNAFPFSGLPDIFRIFLEVLSSATDIPITRLLGSSPGGMNSTGDSDTRNYYDMIRSMQENMLAPRLNQLDEVLLRSALGDQYSSEITYKFNSLWQMNDTEKADMQTKQVATLSALAGLGVDPFILQRDAVELGLIHNLTMQDIEMAEEAANFGIEEGNDDFAPDGDARRNDNTSADIDKAISAFVNDEINYTEAKHKRDASGHFAAQEEKTAKTGTVGVLTQKYSPGSKKSLVQQIIESHDSDHEKLKALLAKKYGSKYSTLASKKELDALARLKAEEK